jgi:hypothetical protein
MDSSAIWALLDRDTADKGWADDASTLLSEAAQELIRMRDELAAWNAAGTDLRHLAHELEEDGHTKQAKRLRASLDTVISQRDLNESEQPHGAPEG